MITVKYTLQGTTDEYRDKVYGPTSSVNTSVEALEMEHAAWDLRATYDAAWERYGKSVIHLPLSASVMGVPPKGEDGSTTGIDWRHFDICLSSVPLPDLCYRDGHQFHSAEVWAMGDAPERGQYVPYRPAENTVECNGTRDTGWYRASNIFGHVTVEWPKKSKPPLPGVASVTKPIYSDCDCYRHGELGIKFRPIGRYGAWQKSILTHHAYTQAAQL